MKQYHFAFSQCGELCGEKSLRRIMRLSKDKWQQGGGPGWDASPIVDLGSRASPDMLKLVTGFLRERLIILLRAKGRLTIGLLSRHLYHIIVRP
jgi:hypothetical protein